MPHARRRGTGSRPGVGARAEVTPLEARRLLSAISFGEPAYYAAGIRTPPGQGAEHVAAGDFNGDGVDDLVVAGDDITVMPVVRHYARVLLANGDGTFAPPAKAVPIGTHTSDVAVGDFNNDGRLDAVVSEDDRWGQVYVLPGNGDGTLGPARSFFSGSRSTDLAVADFSGDGRLDLAAANAEAWTPEFSLAPPLAGGALLRGNGDGTFQSAQHVPTRGRVQHFVDAGDVNHDGHADMVFGQVVIGPGDFAAPESLVFAVIGVMDEPVRPATKVPAAITGMRLADVDGDGALDAVASAMRDFLGNGAVVAVLAGVRDSFAAPALHELPSTWASDLVVADFNEDGRRDVAVAGEDPRWDRPMPVPAVLTLENKGAGAFGEAQIHPLPEDVVLPGGITGGRFNRDRLPDVAAALPGSNRVGVLLNDTPTILASVARLRSAPQTLTARPLARFTLSGVTATTDALQASISWGDGTRSSAATIVANSDGSYSVLGSHNYRRGGIYRITIAISLPSAGLVRHVATIVRVGR